MCGYVAFLAFAIRDNDSAVAFSESLVPLPIDARTPVFPMEHPASPARMRVLEGMATGFQGDSPVGINRSATTFC